MFCVALQEACLSLLTVAKHWVTHVYEKETVQGLDLSQLWLYMVTAQFFV